MSTKIEWCTNTWNPNHGCTKISPGCMNCYAERLAKGRLRGRFGYPADKPFKVVYDSTKLDYPAKLKKSRLIFVSSMGDLFHPDVPDRIICDVFDTIFLQNQHIYILLTKRPERMKDVLYDYVGDDRIDCIDKIFPHVVFGVSVENHWAAESRIPVLLKINCRWRAISAEPLLSEILLKPEWIHAYGCRRCNYTYRAEGAIDTHGGKVDGYCDCWYENSPRPVIDWIIAGVEKGPGRRQTPPGALEDMVMQGERAGIPIFVKQIERGGRVTNSVEDFPPSLRLRQYPFEELK